VLLRSTRVDAGGDGVVVGIGGSAGSAGNNGQDGWVAVSSTLGSAIPGTVGASVELFAGGPTRASPYNQGSQTPMIVADRAHDGSVRGGASPFGLLPADVLADPALAEAAAHMPAGSSSFVYLSRLGVLGFNNFYPGYAMLTYVNAGPTPLLDPTLMGAKLMQFGFADTVEFGGSGVGRTLGTLGAGEVFGALVRFVGDGTDRFSFGFGGQTFSGSLGDGGVLYATGGTMTAVPEPAGLALMGTAMLGLAAALRRAGPGGSVRPRNFPVSATRAFMAFFHRLLGGEQRQCRAGRRSKPSPTSSRSPWDVPTSPAPSSRAR
jgi:hypothetical protein